MLEYGGTDYTLPVIATAIFVLLAVLEYFICKKAKHKFLKFVPFAVPAAFLAEIPLTLTGSSGGFIDLRPLAVFLEVAAAAICAAAIGTGWIIYKLKNK